MIGLDTNVLLRWVVRDREDATQAAAVARRLAATTEPIHVGVIVLAELVWALRGKRFERSDVAGVVRRLLGHPLIDMGSRAEVEVALIAYEAGGAGFADHLIGALNAAAGCATTLTFDKRAAKGPHFTLID